MRFIRQFTGRMFGMSMVLCLIAFLGDIQQQQFTANAEIINTSKVKNMSIQRQEYVQIRISGFGYGDESLDSNISQVEMTTKFEIDRSQKGMENANFDLMVFEKSKDYLCYVEAIHMLYKENSLQECDFLQREGEDYFRETGKKTFVNTKFLHKGDRTKEYFFVLDNTEWTQAINTPGWNMSKKYSVKDDIFIKVTTEMRFTSNEKYEAWSFIFTVIFISLGALALASFLFFLRMTCIYQNYSMERRQLKRKIMEIQETEYSAFLFEQKKRLDDKNPASIGVGQRDMYGNTRDTSLNESSDDMPSTSIQ